MAFCAVRRLVLDCVLRITAFCSSIALTADSALCAIVAFVAIGTARIFDLGVSVVNAPPPAVRTPISRKRLLPGNPPKSSTTLNTPLVTVTDGRDAVASKTPPAEISNSRNSKSYRPFAGALVSVINPWYENSVVCPAKRCQDR